MRVSSVQRRTSKDSGEQRNPDQGEGPTVAPIKHTRKVTECPEHIILARQPTQSSPLERSRQTPLVSNTQPHLS